MKRLLLSLFLLSVLCVAQNPPSSNAPPPNAASAPDDFDIPASVLAAMGQYQSHDDGIEDVTPDQFPKEVMDQFAADPNLKWMQVKHLVFLYSKPKPELKKETERLVKVQKKWAKKFGIEDWTVVLQMVTTKMLDQHCPDQGGCWGESIWDAHRHTGIIFVLKEKEYTKDMRKFLKTHEHRSVKKDQRNTVVHEMLHNVWQSADEETAVQMITEYLNP